MSTLNESDVTQLLSRIREGDESATGELLAVAYKELRALAGHVWRGQGDDQTLQPTALVHEVCARLLKGGANNWNDRKHFFCVAAKAMRNLLTDHARARAALRRGGHVMRVAIGTSEVASSASEIDLLILNETLTKLAKLDERIGQIFELRFLVGLSVTQVAEIVEVSPRTVELDSQFIRAWLQKEMGS